MEREEAKFAEIIVDTNVMIAGLIKRGIVRQLLLAHPGRFITPEQCIDELWEHRKAWNKKLVTDRELKDILDDIVDFVVAVVSKDVYEEWMEESKKLIRDPDDAPVVALALGIDNAGVWTFNTKDFKGGPLTGRIVILKTSDVKAMLEPGDSGGRPG